MPVDGTSGVGVCPWLLSKPISLITRRMVSGIWAITLEVRPVVVDSSNSSDRFTEKEPTHSPPPPPPLCGALS